MHSLLGACAPTCESRRLLQPTIGPIDLKCIRELVHHPDHLMQLLIDVLHVPLELVGLAAVSVVHCGAVLVRLNVLYVQVR